MTDDLRDIAVVGGGIAGLSFAAAARTLAPHLSVTIVDSGRTGSDERWSAVAAAGRRLLEAVGAWEPLAAQAQPIHEMIIGMAAREEPVKPIDLAIKGDVAPGEPFAHMVSNAALVPALAARAGALGAATLAAKVQDIDVDETRARLILADAQPLDARLIVAADGGRSFIRGRAGFRTIGWDYDQAAFVTTVSAERPHHGTAVQIFLPQGPIAALPIPGDRFSIVWTTTKDEAEKALRLSDSDLAEDLNQRLGFRFGSFKIAGPRESYPLRLEMAREMVSARLALLGDAAHAIHPLAGQALNLAFKDCASLADILKEAQDLGLDPGSEASLLKYQRQRRFDAVAMGAVTDGLNRLLSTRSGALRPLIGFGMQIVDRIGPLKDRIAREAAGVEGSPPSLLRR